MSKGINKYTKQGIEDKIDSLDKRSEEINNRLDSIDKTLEKNTVLLAEHMKRSDQLETIVKALQEKDLKPLQRHVQQVEGAFKLIGGLALLLTVITGLVKLFSMV